MRASVCGGCILWAAAARGGPPHLQSSPILTLLITMTHCLNLCAQVACSAQPGPDHRCDPELRCVGGGSTWAWLRNQVMGPRVGATLLLRANSGTSHAPLPHTPSHTAVHAPRCVCGPLGDWASWQPRHAGTRPMLTTKHALLGVCAVATGNFERAWRHTRGGRPKMSGRVRRCARGGRPPGLRLH
jgi:hypothetical protein